MDFYVVRETDTDDRKVDKTVMVDYDGVTETSRLKTAADMTIEASTESSHER